jgi:hypothetical protein
VARAEPGDARSRRRLYSPTVGTVFPAGAAQNGIEMSDVLDQQCGNR